MSIFDFFRKKKPRRMLTTKHAARWGLVANSIVDVKRAAILGRTCKDCKFYDVVFREQKGVCLKFSKPKITVVVAADRKNECLEVEYKRIFYSFRTRISGKGPDNGRTESEENTKKTNYKKTGCHKVKAA